MLVLTHKKGDAVHIGDDVTIRVLGINKYGCMKVGYEAPKEVEILRDSVKKRKENER